MWRDAPRPWTPPSPLPTAAFRDDKHAKFSAQQARRRTAPTTLAAIALAALALALVVCVAASASNVHRVGASVFARPGVLPRVARYASSCSAETAQSPALPELHLVHYELPATVLLHLVTRAASELGWTASPNAVYRDVMHLHAPARGWAGRATTLFVRVHAGEGRRSFVYVKSECASRGWLQPPGDMGANSAHILELLREVSRLASHL